MLDTMSSYHQSVLSDRILELLDAENRRGFYLDLTLGSGGHSQLILDANKDNRVLGIDRDKDALAFSKKSLSRYGDRFHCLHGNFSQIDSLLKDYSESIVAVLMDLGISSHQQDDCPLDMRMDRSQNYSAIQVLNEKSEEELAYIINTYGEERYSKRIASNIIKFRRRKTLTRSAELVEIIRGSLGGNRLYLKKSLARVFQAIRIEVNQELEELKFALSKVYDLLADQGRLLIISFHSLEDRIVKKFFRYKSLSCICPVEFPVCICEKKQEGVLLNKKVIIADSGELAKNHRARSAKLRGIKKVKV